MGGITSRYRREGGFSLIEIRLTAVQQLFSSLDPAPFLEKDLDTEVEDYIVGAVRELPTAAALKLVFLLPSDQLASAAVATLPESIHNYFDYRRELAARDLRFLLQDGRRALAIGLAFLSGCVLVRQLLFTEGGTITYIVGESLLIGGWVAMWRPMEVFLYEWWPLRRRGKIYAKLGAIPVEARPAASPGVSPAARQPAAG